MIAVLISTISDSKWDLVFLSFKLWIKSSICFAYSYSLIKYNLHFFNILSSKIIIAKAKFYWYPTVNSTRRSDFKFLSFVLNYLLLALQINQSSIWIQLLDFISHPQSKTFSPRKVVLSLKDNRFLFSTWRFRLIIPSVLEVIIHLQQKYSLL